jgi:hypothetical protein
MHHVRFLIIYKDIDDPVSMNNDLEEELDGFGIELKQTWATFGKNSNTK